MASPIFFHPLLLLHRASILSNFDVGTTLSVFLDTQPWLLALKCRHGPRTLICNPVCDFHVVESLTFSTNHYALLLLRLIHHLHSCSFGFSATLSSHATLVTTLQSIKALATTNVANEAPLCCNYILAFSISISIRSLRPSSAETTKVFAIIPPTFCFYSSSLVKLHATAPHTWDLFVSPILITCLQLAAWSLPHELQSLQYKLLMAQLTLASLYVTHFYNCKLHFILPTLLTSFTLCYVHFNSQVAFQNPSPYHLILLFNLIFTREPSLRGSVEYAVLILKTVV